MESVRPVFFFFVSLTWIHPRWFPVACAIVVSWAQVLCCSWTGTRRLGVGWESSFQMPKIYGQVPDLTGPNLYEKEEDLVAVAALMIVQVVASCRFVDFIRLWWSWLLTSDLRLSWWGRGRSAAPIWNHDKARQHCQSSANECALDFNVENRFTSRVQSYCARTPGNHKVLYIHTWCRISSINTLKFGSWVIFFPDSIL